MLYSIQVQPGHTPFVHAFHALLYTHLQIESPASRLLPRPRRKCNSYD